MRRAKIIGFRVIQCPMLAKVLSPQDLLEDMAQGMNRSTGQRQVINALSESQGRVATGQGKVREIQGQGKVREFCNWSGKFGILRKVREFWNWSGKFDFLMSYAQ